MLSASPRGQLLAGFVSGRRRDRLLCLGESLLQRMEIDTVRSGSRSQAGADIVLRHGDARVQSVRRIGAPKMITVIDEASYDVEGAST
jgi:hypothetical protein